MANPDVDSATLPRSPGMTDLIIETCNLGKVYRAGKVSVEALRGVNLEIDPSDVFLLPR